MKDITADESSIQDQGVATFENNYSIFRQPFLFGLYRPIEDLDKIASEAFAGRIITMIQAHEEHNVDTSFIKKNYKCAPNQLETKNRILIAPPLNKRKKGAFKDEAIVTFSAKIHYWSNENGSKLSYRMD